MKALTNEQVAKNMYNYFFKRWASWLARQVNVNIHSVCFRIMIRVKEAKPPTMFSLIK